MTWHPLHIARLVVFYSQALLTVLIVALSASLTANEGPDVWNVFTLVIGIFSMIILSTVLIADWVGFVPWVSFALTEIIWNAFLMVMWMTAGGIMAANSTPGLDCDALVWFGTSRGMTNCETFQANEAFVWLSWLVCLGWTITLFTCSIITQKRGQPRVWYQAVASTTWFKPGVPLKEFTLYAPPNGMAYNYDTAPLRPDAARTTQAKPVEHPLAFYTQGEPEGQAFIGGSRLSVAPGDITPSTLERVTVSVPVAALPASTPAGSSGTVAPLRPNRRPPPSQLQYPNGSVAEV